MWITTAKLYWNSTFCLQPPGDAVSRKGVADSLVMGCIPVQFHDGMPHQWPWHWGEWVHESSVLLDWNEVLKGKLDVVEKLRSIPAAEVAAMQRVIARNAHRIHYSRESLEAQATEAGESHGGQAESGTISTPLPSSYDARGLARAKRASCAPGTRRSVATARRCSRLPTRCAGSPSR